MRWLLAAALALHLSPAFAANLVDVPIISPVTIDVIVAVGSDGTTGTVELAPGESQLISVRSVDVSLEIVSGAIRATLEDPLPPNGVLFVAVRSPGATLTMPDPTQSLAVPLIATFNRVPQF